MNLSIVAACFERIADIIDAGGTVQEALRQVAIDLETIQTQDWGKPVTGTLFSSRERFKALEEYYATRIKHDDIPI